MVPNKLYHYTTLNNLALILRSKSIRFGRLDKVNDPTEGESEDFDSFAKYIFISCWTANHEENLALWNMYTPQMRGVRIELELPIFNSYKIGDNENLLVSEEEYINKDKQIFILGSCNIPTKIEYTDDLSKLRPKIRNEIGLKVKDLAAHKRKIWGFEEEYRYRLDILPIDNKTDSDYYPDRYQKLMSAGIPPSIEGYTIKVNDGSFQKMKLRLSPKSLDGDLEIVTSLLEMYNPTAKIEYSTLKGLIR